MAYSPASGAPNPWIFGRTTDIRWGLIALLVPLAIYLPIYLHWGSQAVWPIYATYVVVFATPHMWMTWVVTASPGASRFYDPRAFVVPLFTTVLLVAAIPVALARGGGDLMFTGLFLLGYFHVARQHLGMLKIYDGTYAAAYGEPGAGQALRPLHHACAASMILPLLWLCTVTTPAISVGTLQFRLLIPHVPAGYLASGILGLGAAFLAGTLTWTAFVLVGRQRRGRPLPLPHLMLGGAVALSYGVAFAAVPPRDYLITLALFVSFHDLQYVGFTLNFLRERSRRCPLRAPSWRVLAGGIAYTALVLVPIAVAPQTVGLALILFHNVGHYLMDGMVWKRRYYPSLHVHLGLGERGKPAAAALVS